MADDKIEVETEVDAIRDIEPALAATAPGDPAYRTPRRLSVLAGLAVIVVGSIRFIAGQSDADIIATALSPEPQAALAVLAWHIVTLLFFLLGVALVVTAWGHRSAARSIAWLSTVAFAVMTVMMGSVAASWMGDPLAFYPIFGLVLLAILSFAAAVKA